MKFETEESTSASACPCSVDPTESAWGHELTNRVLPERIPTHYYYYYD